MFLIIVVLIGLTILIIPFVGLYFLHKWLTKKGLKIVGITLFVGFSVWLSYTIFRAIYPKDSFYYSEFKEVTLREAPKSARIIRKNASYPDFHGDYCSASLMSISTDEYSTLLMELKNDTLINRNTTGEIVGSAELDYVMGDYKREQIAYSFTRTIPNQEDHYLFIGFLQDKRTIVTTVCVN
jgi:hypothetical protein